MDETTGSNIGQASNPLIGRDLLLQRLEATLEETRRATPTLVEVAGDPGIGKTSLLQHFALRARAAGASVLSGSGGPLTNHALSETLRGVVDGGGPDPGGGAARQGPAVLIDDLHQINTACLSLLARLLRTPPDRLVLIAAYRPRQVGQTVASVLTSATGMQRELVQLRPLDAVQLAQVLGLPPGPVAEQIHAMTAGNPLYAQAYRSGAQRTAPDGLAPELPLDAARILWLELGCLPRRERRAAQAAAVLGDAFDPALVAVVAGLDPTTCDRLLDQLVARDVLRADLTAEPRLRFRHPVVHATMYRSIRPARRRVMHTVAATALRDQGGAPATYAEHVARSAQLGDLDAIGVLVRAGKRGGAAPPTAVRWLSAARWLVPGEPRGDHLRVDVDLSLADALVSAGRLRESRAVLQHVAYGPATTGEQRARAVLARAAVERLLGRPYDAYALVRAELTYDADRSASTAAMLAAEAAVSGALCGAPEAEAHEALVRRMTFAEADPAAKVRAGLVAAFTACYRGGHAADGPAALDRAAVLVDTMPDARLARSLDLLSMLAWAEHLYERDRAALRHFDRALELARSCGHEPLRPYLLAGRCWASGRQGQLSHAQRDGADAERGARALGVGPLATLARFLRASVVAWQEGPAAARSLAESAALETTPRHRDWFAEVALRMAARLRHESHDRVDTSAALLRGCGDTELSWVEACSRPYWATVLADIALSNGRAEEATWWVDRADRFAAGLPFRGQAAYATAARARIAMDAGSPDAPALVSSALETFADLGWLLAEGSTRLMQSRLFSAAHKWRAAEAELAEVRRIAETTGSRRLHMAAVREQRRVIGYAGRSAPTATLDRLTRREQEIVRLVAEGVSNAEVAERLFVTVKTVEAHLTRIFRKVGVSSRAALVAAKAVNAIGEEPG